MKINRGFTLVELLVVIAIIGLLLAMVIPATQSVRAAARRIYCSNNARQIALALHSYESANGSLPESIGNKNNVDALIHWQAQTLPFIEQISLYQSFQKEVSMGAHPYDIIQGRTTIPILQCPSNPDSGSAIKPRVAGSIFAFTDYCGVSGVNQSSADGLFVGEIDFQKRGIKFAEVRDGLSSTLMFGERPPSDVNEGFGRWLGSQNLMCATIGVAEDVDSVGGASSLGNCEKPDLGFGKDVRGGPCGWTHHWSFHSGGANFSRADASIHFIVFSIDKDLLAALATRNGGETVSD